MTPSELDTLRDDALWLRRHFITLAVNLDAGRRRGDVVGMLAHYPEDWWEREVLTRVMRIARLVE